MSDFNRKQFEDYYNDWGGFGCQYCLHHRMGDSYNIPDVAKAWRHWQASRECMVVEMPRSIEDCGPNGYHSSDADEALILEDVQEALTAAGVKYK